MISKGVKVLFEVDTTHSTISDQALLIAHALADYGHDVDKFFAGFGMDAIRRPMPSTRYPAALMGEMWNRATELSGIRISVSGLPANWPLISIIC